MTSVSKFVILETVLCSLIPVSLKIVILCYFYKYWAFRWLRAYLLFQLLIFSLCTHWKTETNKKFRGFYEKKFADI